MTSSLPVRAAVAALLLAALTVAGLPAARAGAAGDATVVDVPAALAKQLRRAKAAGTVPVLVPSRLRVEDVPRVYPAGRSRAREYRFRLDAAPGCNGANVCAYAFFSGERGAKPAGRKVRLRGGRTGYFTARSCDASCSPPQIQWLRRRVLYTIQVKAFTDRQARRGLVRLADQAIKAGPR